MISPIWSEVMDLAKKSLFMSSPNPRVGCVITNKNDEIIGRGFTQAAGSEHAEIMALNDAKSRGSSLKGATVYVSLEPCSHQGRTGPCCDALIKSDVAKVVASIADPNPIVSGQGFAKLQAAGIEIETGPMEEESKALNIGFFSRHLRHRPWVRMKLASSLDGKIALNNGKSQWITTPEARADGHAWRARSCAVLTGIGTVLLDNPILDTRHVQTSRQPHLVVIDSRLETPLNASLFKPQRRILVYAAIEDRSRVTALKDMGAEVVICPEVSLQKTGKVDLNAMMADLARREVNEVHVEAGHMLNGSLIKAGLVDELLLYMAPKLIGTGLGMANLGEHETLDQVTELNFTSIEVIGGDLRFLAHFKNHLPF